MKKAFEIVGSVLDRFRGLPVRLGRITGKAEQLYRSHGYEPRTINPLANGSKSPVDPFMAYCELYEAGMPGAGRMLSDAVHAELTARFCEGDDSRCQGDLHESIIDETSDVYKWLARFEFDTASVMQHKHFQTQVDEAIEAFGRAKARSRAKQRVLEMGQRNGAVAAK